MNHTQMSEELNISKAQIENLVERLVSERIARIEVDFEYKLKFLESSLTQRIEALHLRVVNIRSTVYGRILQSPDDENEACLDSRISNLENSDVLSDFIARYESDEKVRDADLNEKIRFIDERFDQLALKLDIADNEGRIDTLESNLAKLEEFVQEHLGDPN